MELRGEYVPSTWKWVRDQVEQYESSGGTEALTLHGTSDPVVVTTSRGATTGMLRKNPLMRVEKDGKYLAVGSKGGGPENPAWVRNFLAHPEVELQDGPVKGTYRARLLSGAERDAWYAFAVETWPRYGEYAVTAAAHGREIPVFLLEPVE
jgi:F420H(2)-dependent quinone reductase